MHLFIELFSKLTDMVVLALSQSLWFPNVIGTPILLCLANRTQLSY